MTAKGFQTIITSPKKPVHLLERNYNDRFTALMDQFMPLWPQYRNELNRAPLEHGEWDY